MRINFSRCIAVFTLTVIAFSDNSLRGNNSNLVTVQILSVLIQTIKTQSCSGLCSTDTERVAKMTISKFSEYCLLDRSSPQIVK